MDFDTNNYRFLKDGMIYWDYWAQKIQISFEGSPYRARLGHICRDLQPYNIVGAYDELLWKKIGIVIQQQNIQQVSAYVGSGNFT